MSETYIELLERPEWNKKRKEILERDEHTCQRCGMSGEKKFKGGGILIRAGLEAKIFKNNTLEDSRNVLVIMGDEHEGLLVKCDFSIEELKSRLLMLFFNVVHKERIKYPYKATLGTVNFDNEIHNQIKASPLLDKMREKIKNDEVDVDLEGVYLTGVKEPFIKIELKDNHYFHVHHMCYRKGIEIWEQADEEYVTLCNVCHKIVHESQEIPFFDEAGRDISGNFVRCYRCYGKGYLPEFSYHMGGICFGCHGRGIIE